MAGVEMKVTPIKPIMRSFDKDDRADDERKRLELFLRLVEGMDLPPGRLEKVRTEGGAERFHSLKWLDRNMSIRNSSHGNFRQANNLLKMLLKSEYKKRR
jgi:hypothetical protein